MRRIACTVAIGGFTGAFLFLGAGVASAAPPGCEDTLGASASQTAQEPGPNAGPNSSVGWDTAEGAPNAPGQALVENCGPE